MERPGWWKSPVGKKLCKSIRRREDSFRLKTSWDIVSVITSRIKVEAIVES